MMMMMMMMMMMVVVNMMVVMVMVKLSMEDLISGSRARNPSVTAASVMMLRSNTIHDNKV